MFSHIMVGANDIDVSKKFYDATFRALGERDGMIDRSGRLIYMHKQGVFMVTKPLDGNPATHANGGTICVIRPGTSSARFTAKSGSDARLKPICGWSKQSYLPHNQLDR